MAVANTKSTVVTNGDATQPRVISPSYLSGGGLKISAGMVEVAAADDNDSVYRMVRVPSSAVLYRIEVLNDAITAGTAFPAALGRSDIARRMPCGHSRSKGALAEALPERDRARGLRKAFVQGRL